MAFVQISISFVVLFVWCSQFYGARMETGLCHVIGLM